MDLISETKFTENHFTDIKKLITYYSFFLSILLLCNCKKDIPKESPTVDRMVLIYMAANNDLREDAIICLNKMEAGLNAGNQKLLVFIKTETDYSFILRIKSDKNTKIVSDTIWRYSNENAANPIFLSQVIKDARNLSSAEYYGLVLWSHASSWAPSAATSARTKSFGEDRGVEMDIIDMKNALPADFSYIIFDACSMASIEAIYELKDKAKYILASPTEVLSTSYPYEKIIPHLFGGVDQLKLIAKEFMSYYRSMNGDFSSATISLINTQELLPLAKHMKALLDVKEPKSDFNISNIQRLDFDGKTKVPAYDFLDFLQKNYDNNDYIVVYNQLNKAILYKDNTSSFLGRPINTFCGLSIYLPRENDVFKNYYSGLDWYTSGGSYNLFR